MKRVMSLLFTVAAIAALLVSCNGNKAKIMEMVNAINDMCPIDMGMMGEMTSVEYDEEANEVQSTITMDEDFMSVEALAGNKRMATNQLKLYFLKEETKESLKELISAGVGYAYIYKGAESGKTCKISLTNEEINDLWNNPIPQDELNEMMLENQIAMESAQYPSLADVGLTIMSMRDDGEYVIYECEVDENLYDISAFRAAKNEMKEAMRETFDDVTAKQQLSVFAAADRGLIYRYYGETSGDAVDIVFTSRELRTISAN